MNDSLAIGVDLGATKIASALVTRTGEVLATRQSLTLVNEGPDAVLDRIAADIQALRDQAPREVLGVGIGSPGLIDSARGIVIGAVNMQWKEVPLGPGVSTRLKNFPVLIDNDANANALGEGYFGSAKNSRDYVLLTVGSGLGSGVVSAGKIITGAHNAAADLGHISLDPDNGPLCRCGHRGCETICSGPGLVNATRRLLAEKSMRSSLLDTPELSPADILAAAANLDPLATAAIALLAKWMGHVAAIAAAVTDPDLIIIGGGLGIAVTDLIAPEMAREYLRRVPKMIGPPTIRPATLPSSALGSASLVWSNLP